MSLNGYKLNCKITRNPEKIVHNFKVVHLPRSVNLKDKCGPVYDQGSLGSCTANAICSAYIFDDIHANPSRLYLYHKERLADGNATDDAGSTLTQGVTQAKVGICEEKLWPYQPEKFPEKPPTECDDNAKLHHVVDAVQVLQTVESMKGCLASGFPFVLGFAVFPSFEKAVNGNIPMPEANEEPIGGHAIEVVGYTSTYWIIKNSWSDKWGDKGYGYIPMQYFLNTNWTSDLWKITKVTIPKSEGILSYLTSFIW
jgi:C1A family cysteine protease